MLKIPYQKLRLSSKGNLNLTTSSISNNNSTYSTNSTFYRISRRVLQGIPVLSIFALVGILFGATIPCPWQSTYQAYAASNKASASLTVDDNVINDVITIGEETTAYISHEITVQADDIGGYTLTITGPTGLEAPSSATVISGAAGRTGAGLSDNTWGYSWSSNSLSNAEQTYASFTGDTQTLEHNTNLVNGSAELNKKLIFAARFGQTAVSGHYKATVALNLTVTPKEVTGGAAWSTGVESGITTMQEMDIDVCRQVPTPTYTTTTVPTLVLKDARDETTYTIARWTDGNCWMTQNLHLVGPKSLSNQDTDLNDGLTSYALPGSSLSDAFFKNDAQNLYYANDLTNGAYYSWCTATANSCQVNGSAIGSNVVAKSSICPRGWSLPTGDTGGQYQGLAIAAGMTTSNGSTLIRATPYNFVYSGRVLQGQLRDVNTAGYYWTKTSSSDSYANRFDFSDSNFRPANNGDKYGGYSIRCVIAAAPTAD